MNSSNTTNSTSSSSSNSTTSTSTQQVLTALISNGIVFAAFLSAFLLLRIKLKRIYEPKSSFNLINDEKRPDPLPKGLWQWFIPLLKKSDNFIIQQAGLDGYFFLRYLFIISAYCLVSMAYIFPILLPVNASNGMHQTGLNQLAYQNIKNEKRYYAHIFIGWIFFWGFVYVIYRELYFYTSMKQAVLASPRYAKKLSSRTVLFQTVPKQYLSEEEFSKLFDGVKRVWIARGATNIGVKVDERASMAMQLENALNSYLKSILKKIRKQQKKNTDLVISDNVEDYIPYKKRPKFRKRFWKKKLDTIDYIKEQLPVLNKEIEEMQENHINADPFNSVFVEFESQYQAQVALQVSTYHAPVFMSPAYIGLEPKDLVWFNLRMLWWERLIRTHGAVLAIIALVLLWSIPVAFVGMISNITYLTNKLHWLRFIYKLPDVLLGLLTSLAPTIALAVLMMFLPIFIRAMAVVAGSPSSQLVEYFTQQAYFAFQVIQVFLVTTLASAATSAVTQIVEDPSTAMNLLATNLPKASNFYISYIILQGMSISSGALLQLSPLIMFYLLGTLLDNTPRKKHTRFVNLGSMQWGTTFPVYTNLAVILFSYSIISPIILLFGFCGFFLLYVSYLYNLTYVFQESPDSRGMHYPRALFQTMVGLYIGQICLLGLFVVGKGWGPIVLQVVCLIITVIVHIQLNESFDRIMQVLPVDTMKPLDGKSDTPSFKNIYKKIDDPNRNHKLDGVKELPKFPIKKFQPRSHQSILRIGSNNNTNNREVSSSIFDQITENTLEYHYDYQKAMETKTTVNYIPEIPLLADGDTTTIPDAPFWKRFLLPHIYCSYKVVKSRLPEIYGLIDPDEVTDDNIIAHAYDYPAVSAQCPSLWIPKDEFGFSQAIIRDFEGIINISDKGAHIDPKGKLVVDGKPPTNKNVMEESVGSDNPFTDGKDTETFEDESIIFR
ncbi:Rsn1p NDAI_0K00540 [Naumovozyma dairenensis CBS 421]|uniref:DUF221-domain-containing protein n=1 Tax=Naumovozyma dairenensis (strain ATCC 10597 / BCRC 20456 / CBS 421 / NBRC 0211 / NRRL Y-12639) TaxID=1071378 RepID=G0WHI4_NAUDC|nr:hypothetical protein NDAI_0K00540 [Naumovozyma dairenensis CBS 421]CCD27245.1 hypothetical protein NDAI_0K00540 [Naumovozyma dairenensis CBS 421]